MRLSWPAIRSFGRRSSRAPSFILGEILVADLTSRPAIIPPEFTWPAIGSQISPQYYVPLPPSHLLLSTYSKHLADNDWKGRRVTPRPQGDFAGLRVPRAREMLCLGQALPDTRTSSKDLFAVHCFCHGQRLALVVFGCPV